VSVRVALSVRDRSLSRRGAAPPLHSRRSGPDRRMPPGGGDWRRVPAGIPSASRHDAARRADVSSAEPTPDSEADGAIPWPSRFHRVFRVEAHRERQGAPPPIWPQSQQKRARHRGIGSAYQPHISDIVCPSYTPFLYTLPLSLTSH